MKAYEIPESSRTARGTAIINLIQLEPEEKITAMIPIKEYKEKYYLFMATKTSPFPSQKRIITPFLEYLTASLSLRPDPLNSFQLPP